MTLIAHSVGYDVPFIVGDILISSYEKQKSFTPPSIFVNVSEFLNEPNRRYFPYELAQKVYVITRDLAIALSGDVLEMTQFLIELRQQCRFYDNKVKPEHIHRILKEYDLPKNFSDASFFMMHIEQQEGGAIYVTQFNFGNWDSIETAIYSEVFANGSGSVSFRNWANESAEFTSTHVRGDIQFIIQSSTCLIAKLLAIERASLATFKNNWGAGFELIFYTEVGFVKFQEIVFLIFEARFNDDGDIGDPALTKAMYYKYVDETLIILSIDILYANYTETNHNLQIKGNKLRVGTFPVFPLDLKIKPDESKFSNNTSFSTNKVAVAYTIVNDQEQIFIPALYNGGSEIKVEFVEGTSFEVNMHLAAITKVKDGAKKAYPNMS